MDLFLCICCQSVSYLFTLSSSASSAAPQIPVFWRLPGLNPGLLRTSHWQPFISSTDEDASYPSPVLADPDSLVRGMDPRIRIHTKMPWIRNTGKNYEVSCFSYFQDMVSSSPRGVLLHDFWGGNLSSPTSHKASQSNTEEILPVLCCESPCLAASCFFLLWGQMCFR